jgi:hypothetical protein
MRTPTAERPLLSDLPKLRLLISLSFFLSEQFFLKILLVSVICVRSLGENSSPLAKFVCFQECVLMSTIFVSAKKWGFFAGDNPATGIELPEKKAVRQKHVLLPEQIPPLFGCARIARQHNGFSRSADRAKNWRDLGSALEGCGFPLRRDSSPETTRFAGSRYSGSALSLESPPSGVFVVMFPHSDWTIMTQMISFLLALTLIVVRIDHTGGFLGRVWFSSLS